MAARETAAPTLRERNDSRQGFVVASLPFKTFKSFKPFNAGSKFKDRCSSSTCLTSPATLIQWIYIVVNRRSLMVKRLTQHGNSAALIIDKPVLDLLKITMDTPLEIATDGQNLIISPVRSARREQRFRSALEAVNRRHGKTLKALAE
jgi:antitoxin component of MazEF toxin-antitoxin module